MAPKKAQKMSLNEFLGDSALGSWADEMESLPNAPAPRTDEERANDRHGRRDDFLSSRPDRGLPPREDLPLPTQPPYTAFVGNLDFDLTEMQLEEFFGLPETKSIKIIKDRDDKPKGFGYVEFTKLEGLKDALAKSGSNFSGRTIRVSVAEPPKDRPSFAGGFDDDSKFESPWRRDGPLPDLSDSRDSSRRRFDGAPSGDRTAHGVSESATDWRSTRPPTRSAEPEGPSFKRKTSGFATPDSQVGAADKEDMWTIGGKFKPAGTTSEDTGSKFGSLRGRGDMGPPKELSSNIDESDWRSAARPKSASRNNTSPTSSTPPTPQTNRRKLELFPRSGTASVVPTPLSSPKISAGSSSRSNPFGAAKPVDVSAREKAVAERLDKERELSKDRLSHPMSRTNSRTASDRTLISRTRTPPPAAMSPPLTPPSPKPSGVVSANVRPSVSFANVASAKRATMLERPEEEMKNDITAKVAELTV